MRLLYRCFFCPTSEFFLWNFFGRGLLFQSFVVDGAVVVDDVVVAAVLRFRFCASAAS